MPRRGWLPLALCPVLAAGPGATAEDPYALAVAAYAEGDHRAARGVLANALAASPGDARLHFLLGLIERDDTPSRLREAAEELRTAIGLDPRLPDAAEGLAEVLQRLGRNREAIDVLRTHLRTNPADIGAQARLGISLQMEGDGEEGLALLRQATEAAPLDPMVWLELGRALHRAGDAAAAVPPLQRAVQLDPASHLAHYALAQAYLRTGRAEEGEAMLARYQDLLQRRTDEVYEDLGRRRLHRLLARQEDRLRKEPDAPPREHVALADFYRRAGAPDQGLQFFRELSERAPGHIGPLVGEAVVARSAGDPERSWTLLQRARALEPSSAVVLSEMMRSANTDARRAELEAILRAAEGGAGTPREIALWLGVLAMEQGRLEEAERRFLSAREQAPDDADVMLNLGVLQARRGNLVRALGTFQGLVETAPTIGEAWFNLGMAEVQLGLVDLASPHLERALFILGDQPPALNMLASLRARAGDPASAALLLERSLAVDPDQPAVRAELTRLRAAMSATQP